MISNVNMMGLVSNVSAVVAPEAVVGITEDIIPFGVKLVRSAPVISVEGRKPVVGETSGLDSKMEFPMIGDDVSVLMEAETSVELAGWTSGDVTTVGREAIGVLKISDSLGTIVNPVVDANR